MGRFGRHLLAVGVVGMACAAWIPSAAAAEEGEQVVLQADRTLAEALRTGNKTAAGSLLNADFAWTDVEGRTRSKAESLEEPGRLAANDAGETEVKSYYYGELAIIFGFHHDARFCRIWIKRPEGWRAYVFLDTPVPKPGGDAEAHATNAPTGECDNPCKTLPYTPTTEADKAVVAAWQKTKVDEWNHDADDWTTHIADEFRIINSKYDRDKTERTAIARKQQEAGIGVAGDPVISMSMADFGNAVTMIAHHYPYHGGKPYYNVRVFVKRNGQWLLAWSQQTTIEAAAVHVGAQTSR